MLTCSLRAIVEKSLEVPRGGSIFDLKSYRFYGLMHKLAILRMFRGQCVNHVKKKNHAHIIQTKHIMHDNGSTCVSTFILIIVYCVSRDTD